MDPAEVCMCANVCVCVSEEEASQEHMLRNRAQNKPSDLYRAVETLKTTEAKTLFKYFSLSVFVSLTDKGQMFFLMLIRISK